jgi:phosphotransferase system HPr (HPr) family protein
MSEVVVTRLVVINDPHGMHMRPADLFSRTARGFNCKVWLNKDGYKVDGTSILDIMTLAVVHKSELTIECVGPDAEKAIEVLAEVIQRIPAPDGQKKEERRED